MPASVFALEPPATASVVSLNLAVNRFVIVFPAGPETSSVIAASVDEPLAVGASFTAVTTVSITSVADE